MIKIAVNRCYGGFSLSEEAIFHYAKIKGLTLYPEKTGYGFVTYWTVPEDQRPSEILSEDFFTKATLEERIASNAACTASQIYSREIDRDDPTLIQTIEELGKAADGDHAQLAVVEVPDGVDWEIDEYDGMEHVAEKHRTW